MFIAELLTSACLHLEEPISLRLRREFSHSKPLNFVFATIERNGGGKGTAAMGHPIADWPHENPTIVFVPGAFHVEAHFAPISSLLNQISYPTVTVELPTTVKATTAKYPDDVHAIRSVLEKLIEEEGKEVMLAPCSYGGVPGCQSVGGMQRSSRKAEGKAGGVVHVLFIAALLVEQGEAMVKALEGGKAPNWAVFKVSSQLSIFRGPGVTVHACC